VKILLGTLAFSQVSVAADLNNRLAAGEIIVSSENVPGSTTKRGEVLGVVDAPPEKVWQVITDVNHFHEFMPRTIRSQMVTPENVQEVLQKKPTQAQEVEAILGPTAPDPALFRVPGQKYIEHLYGHVDLPWPMDNRWYVLKMQRDESHASQRRYTSSWSLIIGNLKENRGEWRLEPFGEHQTLALYRLITDPGGPVPQFLVKQGTYVTLPKIIDSVRKRVATLAPH